MRGWMFVALIACGERGPAPVPQPSPADAPDERADLRRFSPRPPVPPDPTNRFAGSTEAARLGQQLFFEPGLSGPTLLEDPAQPGKVGERGLVSCFTCHDGPAMDDRRGAPDHLSIGTGRGTRNSPPLIDSSHYRWINWAGRFDSQWSLALAVIEKPEVMNGSRVEVARLIAQRYRAGYEAAFGALAETFADTKRFPPDARPKSDGAWERMTDDDRATVDRVYVHAGKAIAAYLRLLVGSSSPFDRYAAGQPDAISAAAKRGFRLFLAHCKVCHDGPLFTDHEFHALAVAQFGPDVPKLDGGRHDDVPPLLASPFNADGPHSDARTTGRLAGLKQPTARAEFRTPTLRNVAVTAPYMHAGQFRTLANVVAFYKAGGGEVEGIVKDPLMKPLPLRGTDADDLVEFMKTLTDDPLPRALVEPPLAYVLDELKRRGFAAAAQTIEARITQKPEKMMLRVPEGIAAAQQLLALADVAEIRALHAVMPRSTVELARAVAERGVPVAEATAIAKYLTSVVAVLKFETLAAFDENHSHVVGREWQDIDYSGEGMTWQSQRDDWTPKGVQSFKRAAFIHAYFVGAEPLPHWARVYRPRGKMASVPAP